MGYPVTCLGMDMKIASIERVLECLVKDDEVLSSARAKGRKAQQAILEYMLGECDLSVSFEAGEGYEAVIDGWGSENMCSRHVDFLQRIGPAMRDGSRIVFCDEYETEIFREVYRDGRSLYEELDILSDSPAWI